MKTAITISPEGEVTVHEDEITLDFLQGEVKGWIETAPNLRGVEAEGYVNEEGLIIQMPRNPVAESFFGYGPLCGPCVVVGPIDEEGNSTPITPEVLALFVSAAFAG